MLTTDERKEKIQEEYSQLRESLIATQKHLKTERLARDITITAIFSFVFGSVLFYFSDKYNDSLSISDIVFTVFLSILFGAISYWGFRFLFSAVSGFTMVKDYEEKEQNIIKKIIELENRYNNADKPTIEEQFEELQQENKKLQNANIELKMLLSTKDKSGK